MAERIAEISPIVMARYPWHEWTDGSAWQATRGVDFHVAPKSFISMMLGYARRKG